MDSINQLPLVHLQKDDVLFEQGDSAEYCYILKAGTLGARIVPTDDVSIDIDHLMPTSLVGERDFNAGQTYSATVYARDEAHLHRLDASTYQQLMADNPSWLNTLMKKEHKRQQHWQFVQIMTDLLGPVEPDMLEAIKSRLRWEHFASDSILVQQGDVANDMHIIISGRVQFVLDDGSVVGEASKGETIGEYGLVSTQTRSATVRALRDTSVAIISRAAFETLAATYPQLSRAILRIVVERQQRELGHLPPVTPSGSLTLALVPTQPNVDVQAFARQLCAALQPYGDPLVLDASLFESASGLSAETTIDSPYHLSVVEWLNQLQARHQHVILLPDGEWNAWTRRCISQSDRVLLVAKRSESAEIGPIERHVSDTFPHTRCDLAMWHAPDTVEPTETARWLDRRNVHTHYQLRDGDTRHFSRLARRLTRRAIGITLAGGGARGYVHLGAYKALEECGVPIDYVGGASFGAHLGVGQAREQTFAEMMEEIAVFNKKDQQFDTTLPLVALNKTTRMTNACKAYFGDRQVEDLWIPYLAIATNLTQQSMDVIERGPVWKAVRKSLAIPGVFTPFCEDGDVIVDGGVLNNFPADIVAARAESTRIIGIRCASDNKRKRDYDMEADVSGWRVLAGRLLPFVKPLRTPPISDTLMRSLLISSLRLAKENIALCDLYMNLYPRGVGMLESEKFPDIVTFGYEHSAEMVKAWAAQQPDLQRE